MFQTSFVLSVVSNFDQVYIEKCTQHLEHQINFFFFLKHQINFIKFSMKYAFIVHLFKPVDVDVNCPT